MIRTVFRIVVLFVSLLAVSCSGGDSFVIGGQIADYENSRVQIVYLASNGQFQSVEAMTDERGNFNMSGFSEELTAVEMFLPGNGRVALFAAKNGDKINFRFNPTTGEIEVKGNKPSELLGEWFAANRKHLASHDSEEINHAVEKFVIEHEDSPASLALLFTVFDSRKNPMMADSLKNRIDKDAFTVQLLSLGAMLEQQVNVSANKATEFVSLKSLGDTLIPWNPINSRVSFLAFVDNPGYSGRDTLRNLYRDYKRRRLRVLEIHLVSDSASWVRSLSGDSARWERGWLPGLTGSKSMGQFQPPVTPYYIVVDSTGTQLFRGADIKKASAITRKAAR